MVLFSVIAGSNGCCPIHHLQTKSKTERSLYVEKNVEKKIGAHSVEAADLDFFPIQGLENLQWPTN